MLRLGLRRLSAATAAAAAATSASCALGAIASCEEPIGNKRQFAAINAFRQKLQVGDTPLVGIGIQLADPTSTDALSDCSDFLWFDMEHTPLSPEMLKWHIMVAHGRDCPVIVRVPGPNLVVGDARPWGTYIKHALDSNADGVVVPQIRTADDVRAIVADCRYPGGGSRPPPYDVPTSPEQCRRGFGPTTPMNYGRIPMGKYLNDADDAVFVAVMIETTEAVRNIDAICSVKGLDCVVIGANDLSGAMGVGTPAGGNHPKVQGAIDEILAAAKRHGKSVFFSTRDAKLASALAAKGVQILHVGSDVLAAVSYQTKLVASIKGGAA